MRRPHSADCNVLHTCEQLLLNSAFKLGQWVMMARTAHYAVKPAPLSGGEGLAWAFCKDLVGLILLWQQLLRSRSGGLDTETPRRLRAKADTCKGPHWPANGAAS